MGEQVVMSSYEDLQPGACQLAQHIGDSGDQVGIEVGFGLVPEEYETCR